MFVQTQTTPNPNSLKFLPGKTVSNSGSYEITNKNTKLVNDIRDNHDIKKCSPSREREHLSYYIYFIKPISFKAGPNSPTINAICLPHGPEG